MDDTDSSGGLGRFLTLADVADVLNISSRSAYALVRSGELPAIKVGGHGHWRIERSVLESFIEAKYEEARRSGLWRGSEFTDVVEPTFGAVGGFSEDTNPRPDR
ncbi:excisionase family DNA binding protein [Glaciihabitans tibetensis]|uniref:Excisionase family DNA binding protein n=1 Tax=Glaciihabitans tibetensis TaxID=1266600 RepID=A0A2T0VFH7_9MICO|nr:helix-turn-helix domain-containing protein [Glaciihabitans tibetensis]PRY68951.1 excisionase family DNA binding protein [Glaciihabitans tibetensis]